MKNRSTIFIATLISVYSLQAQQTRIFTDPQEKFKEAKELYQKEQYSLAYPLLKELDQERKETHRINEPIVDQEIQYYLTVCGLKQNEDRAANMATEYIEVEKNVKLHVTDLGEGQPIVLIHGWPLSDAMYKYQYAYFVEKGYRVIGITLRGFGKSDKPYGKYDYDIYADDIKVVLDKLNIEDATLGGDNPE